MILTIAGIVLTIILILCFFNIKVGVALFLGYTLLVPIDDITLGPVNLGGNLVKTILLLSLLFDFKIRHHYKFSWKLILPFLIYYVIIFLIIPLQNETPENWMYNSWRVSIMSTLFGAFVVYNVSTRYIESIKLFRWTLIFSIFVAGIYGLYLTTTNGFNPYINLIELGKGSTFYTETLKDYFEAEEEGRMFGRISSVFEHPMNFGLFIGLGAIYLYAVRLYINKWLMAILLAILSLDALFCGVRSCIGGLVIAIAFYLLFSRNLKFGLATLVIGLIAYNYILKIPELSSYIGSITDINNTKGNVQGSSLELRMDQLNGCIAEIRESPIFGKGYGWDTYYKANYGDHPVILSFESLIYVVLCNNGLVGILIWFLLIFFVIKNNHKFRLNDPILADSLLVFYISYSCITGEYGYMQYYLLFYICMVSENRIVQKNK